MSWIVAWGVLALTSAALAGFVAAWKNRDYSFWMAWCFLLPPLLLWLVIMPKQVCPRRRRPTVAEVDHVPRLARVTRQRRAPDRPSPSWVGAHRRSLSTGHPHWTYWRPG